MHSWVIPAWRNSRPYLKYACVFILHGTKEMHSTLPSPSSFPLVDFFSEQFSYFYSEDGNTEFVVTTSKPFLVKGLKVVRFNLTFCQKASSTTKYTCTKSAILAIPMSHNLFSAYKWPHSSLPECFRWKERSLKFWGMDT